MAGQNFDMNKPHLNICTIGSRNHGKTTLLAAITKVLAETIPGNAWDRKIVNALENRENGIPPMHSEYQTESYRYTHYDCPGSADDIRKMISDAGHMDAAILVVAVPEGVTEETREQVLLLHELGVPYVVGFINKCEPRELLPEELYPEMSGLVEILTTVDSDELFERRLSSVNEIEGMADQILEQADNLFEECGFSDCPIVKGSALYALNGLGYSGDHWEDAIRELIWELESYRELTEQFGSAFG